MTMNNLSERTKGMTMTDTEIKGEIDAVNERVNEIYDTLGVCVAALGSILIGAEITTGDELEKKRLFLLAGWDQFNAERGEKTDD